MIQTRKLTFALLGLTALSACSSDDGDSGNPGLGGPPAVVLGAEVFSNPDDSRILVQNTEEGSLSIFGEKDITGFPTAIETIEMTNQAGESFTYEFNDEFELETIIDDNDVTYSFEWTGDEEFTLVANGLSDGERVQVSTPIDLSEGASGSSFSSFSPASVGPVRSERNLSLSVSPLTPQSSGPSFGAAGAGDFSDVTVMKCGVPTDQAQVEVRATRRNGDVTPYRAVFNPSVDSFRASFPQQPSTILAENVVDFCNATSSALGTACSVGGNIQPAQITAICATLGSATANPGVFVGCEAALAGFTATCAIDGLGSTVPGTPSLSGQLCEETERVVDSFIEQQDIVSLTPVAVTTDTLERITGEPQAVVEGATYPDFTLSADDGVGTGLFFVNPPAPEPFEDYVASINVTCISEPVEVEISIIGTDDYTDSITQTITTDSNLELLVPGAESLVLDRLTVRVDGEVIATASVLF